MKRTDSPAPDATMDAPPSASARTQHAPLPTVELAPDFVAGSAPVDSGATLDQQVSRETGEIPPRGANQPNLDFSISPNSISPSNISPNNAAQSGATAEFSQETPNDSLVTMALPTGGPRELPTVPGYEILGELGRGGMGVVYKARQIGLNRIVALKMVLAGAHASPEKLARFHTEAVAVARAQHPNIVQIYEVGEHDGLPYFSLEYIDGSPLDKKIDRKPQKPREAAELTLAMANAMHYAHERNIVHRDLKPANVLVSTSGVAKVTDFGLAKAVESDDSHTRSGTILGSPSYMAPEQARGDIHLVGPLSDQYGVGAILYEMLTGRPPFQGATIFDTLDQVQSKEPVPPTQLAPRVPADLETICLKCLQKEPAKRYPHCGTLAEDLQRFLNGEPILARPVSAPERLLRWCKRNPKIAALSAASLLLLLLGFGLSTAFAVTYSRQNLVIAREKVESDRLKGVAQQEAKEALRQRGIAEQLAHSEKAQRQVADEARKQADQFAQTATRQATLALQTIQTMISKVQQQLSEVPGTQQLKKDLLQTAMIEMKKVEDLIDKSTSKEATQLAIHVQLGGLFRQLGETDKAAQQFEKALAIARDRIVIKEGSDASRANLAACLRHMGDIVQERTRDMETSARYFEEALAVRQSIVDHPKPMGDDTKLVLVLEELGEDHTRLGALVYRLGDPARALPHFQKALFLRQQLLDQFEEEPLLKTLPEPARKGLRGKWEQALARSNLAVGEMSFRMGDTKAAIAAYTAELAVRQRLFDANPKVLGNKFELARTHGNFADIYLYAGQLDEAARHYQAALTHLQDVAAADKENTTYLRDLGLAWYRMGSFALREGEPQLAAEHYARALVVRHALAEKDPTNDRRQMELMLALAHCGQPQQAAELAEKYRQSQAADNELLLDVARTYAQCAAAVMDMPEETDRYAGLALDAIRAAIEQGYKDSVYLDREVDFDPLRTRPEFKSLLERLQTEPVEKTN